MVSLTRKDFTQQPTGTVFTYLIDGDGTGNMRGRVFIKEYYDTWKSVSVPSWRDDRWADAELFEDFTVEEEGQYGAFS